MNAEKLINVINDVAVAGSMKGLKMFEQIFTHTALDEKIVDSLSAHGLRMAELVSSYLRTAICRLHTKPRQACVFENLAPGGFPAEFS